MHPRPALNPRLLALLGVVAVAALVPLAGAAAGPVLDDAERLADPRAAAGPDAAGRARQVAADSDAGPASGAAGTADSRGSADSGPESHGSGRHGSGPHEAGPHESGPSASRPQDTATAAPDSAPSTPLLDTAAHCGPELSSPEGVEAQTCVLTQGTLTWARTYYRNATGESLDAVLSVMGPKGRTVQMHCAVGAEDEPGACDTPRERTTGAAARYTAVAEFASEGGGALLLRSGSNSSGPRGS
ncbi:hypothetical protein [Streptomyces sp. NPDC059063]|uniref:hypothetical protein n=1 Tax=unclassified Streptomyces TaxID=2593676 RepID=UPI0036B10496